MAAPALRTSANVEENIFKSLEDNIRLVSRQIKDGEGRREEITDYDKEVYWRNVAAIFQVLSKETTKISLAFSKKPFPSNKNTDLMLRELEKAMLTLVSIYYCLPLSQGTTLSSHLQQAVLRVLDSLESFTSSLSKCLNSDSHSQRLQWTGGVWEAADFHLLKDNQECVLKSLKVTAELVEDALGEIDQASENDGQVEEFTIDAEQTNVDTWSEQDKRAVASCIGLVKTVKSVLKKTRESVFSNGETESREGIAVLDELAGLISGVSEAVDDFVCGIYAPVNYTSLSQNAQVLSDLILNVLKFLKDCKLTSDQDTKWLDFLSQATTHNLTKLKESLQPQANHEDG